MTTRKLFPSIVVVLLMSICVIAQTERDRARARTLEPLIIQSAKRYGIDPRILWTLCFVESRFRTGAVSPKGARGPMQFMPETAARYGLTNPHDPRASIDAAARYLRDLLNCFGGRVDLALAAYNSGEGTVQSFRSGKPLLLGTGKVINPRGLITGGIPPYEETRNYVTAILKIANGSSASLRNHSRRNSSPEKSSSLMKNKFAASSSFIDLDQ